MHGQICLGAFLILTIISGANGFGGSIILVHGETDQLSVNIALTAINDLTHNGKFIFDKADIIQVPVKGKIPKIILDALCKALKHSFKKGKVPLILDMSPPGVPSETVKSFCASLALPTVTNCFGKPGDIKAWHTIEPDEEKHLIQISPPAETLIGVIQAIVAHLKITNIAVLYGEEFVPAFRATSTPIITDLPVRVITKVISGDIRYQLKELNKLEYNNYFVLGDAVDVLAEADDLKFLNQHNWFVAKLQINSSVECDCDATVLYMIPLLQSEAPDTFLNLMDNMEIDTTNVAEIDIMFLYDVVVRAVLAAEEMDKAGKWPASSSYVLCDDFKGEKVKSDPDFDFKTAIKEVSFNWTFAPFHYGKNGDSYMKFIVYIAKLIYRRHSEQWDVVSVGIWQPGNNTITETGETPLETLPTKPHYRVVTNEQPPFVIKLKGNKYEGLCIDILQNLSTTLGFTYFIYDVPDGKMGYIDDNGEWSGIVSELIEKRADFAMTAISIMVERERVIDFTMPYYDPVGISILMKKPEVTTSLFKFLTVLETDVWLCILAAYFLTSFLMWVFDRWSPYSYQNNKEKYKDDEEKRIFNFKECLWFCMTSLTPQGGGEAPKNLSGRLVAATWWLFGFIIMASYTANLAAFLTVSRLDVPIESLDDLSKQYKIQYAPVNGSSEMNYFQRMANIENRFYEIWKDMSLNDSLSPVERSKLAVWDYPVSDKFTKMWQAITEAALPASLDDALTRVRASKSSSEGFALLGDGAENLYYYHTSCDLQIVGEEFSRKPYAIALQKGSHLREPFNNQLQALINDGALQNLKTKWWKAISTREKCEELNEEIDGISIKNIGGVFIVIVLGIGFAIVTLTLEYFWYKYKREHDPTHVGPAKGAWLDKSDTRTQPTHDANKYLDPLNLYTDHFTRRPNAQRSYSNNYYQW